MEQRRAALRLLLDDKKTDFPRSLEWYTQSDSNIPDGVWSLLHNDGFVHGNVVGGMKWRLTLAGWIEACALLRDEIHLDKHFGILSAHLKDLTAGRTLADTTARNVSSATGLSEEWVLDAVDGQMAESIYSQHGGRLIDKMGTVEIPVHIGNKIE